MSHLLVLLLMRLFFSFLFFNPPPLRDEREEKKKKKEVEKKKNAPKRSFLAMAHGPPKVLKKNFPTPSRFPKDIKQFTLHTHPL